jgi:MFS transporter, PPP family, 3-phenylpropionic acid transporter
MSSAARMALNYFIFFGALGAFWPYLGPHLRGLGFSGAQIGALTAIQPIAVALFAPAIGAYADQFGRHRRVFRIMAVCGASVALILSRASGFLPVLVLFVAWASFVAALLPIMDSYAITTADTSGVPYGRLRLWGTLGYMIVVTAVGWASQTLPRGAFFVAYAALLLCAALAAGALPPSQNRARTAGPPMRIDLQQIRGQPALLAMLIISLCTAIGMSTLGSFFSIYLTSELGGTNALLGTVNAVLALSEIPVMLGAGWLQRVIGNRGLIGIALSAYIVRFTLYAIAPNSSWILPIQVLHGLTYAIFLLASVRLIYELAGRDRAATMQSVLAAALATGNVLGALLNGFVADAFGIRAVFVVAVCANVIALGVFALAWRQFRTPVVVYKSNL